VKLRVLFFSAALFVTSAFAHTGNTGYSGAPGSRGTCAGSCHGSSGGTVSVFGFPQSYTPNQQYLITVRKLSGSTISNFNASCRIGTGSTNAGTLATGTNTSTYNYASGETNGIHFTSANHDSGRFMWTAPAAGTGSVKLYVAAHQGAYSGANTVITITAQEAASAPGPASAPNPANSAINVPITTNLRWTIGNNTQTHDLYLSLTNPPQDMIWSNFVHDPLYDPPVDLITDTVYYWQVTERNPSGETAGPVWSFRTEIPNAVQNPEPALLHDYALGPVYPNPFNATVTIPFVLPKSAAATMTLYDLFGRAVATLASGSFAAGTHQVTWSSVGVGSGIYFLRLQSDLGTRTLKIVALK
jgi:hypothetical protein